MTLKYEVPESFWTRNCTDDSVQRTTSSGKGIDCDLCRRQSRKLIGIITDRDLALYVVAEGRDANSTLVQDAMTKEPITCSPEDDLQKALDAMQSHQVRRIPVVDRGGQLIGIIAQADIATRAEEPEKTAETVEEIKTIRRAGSVAAS